MKAPDAVVAGWGVLNVRSCGAVGDGRTDDTAAITTAHRSGALVFYPAGTYPFVGPFPACEGGLIGAGWSMEPGAQSTTLVFSGCTNPQIGAITPKQTTPKSSAFRIEHLMILASSWDAATGCLGYGLDLGAPVILRNVYVGNFKRSNLWLHHVWPAAGSFVTGPYASLLENVYSAYAGEHGCLVGFGANVLTVVNYQGKWNGASAYGVAPAAPGLFDGFCVAASADGNDVTPYNPSALTILGGDCSYNARYGWNFETVVESGAISPAYAEGNRVNQVHAGNGVSGVDLRCGSIAGGLAGFTDDQVYGPAYATNRFAVGGQQVHPAIAAYPSNAVALAAGLTVGAIYRNGDALQVVH